MGKDGIILLIEDDLDDQEIIGEALKELEITNKLVPVDSGEKALNYLQTQEPPFLILCGYNLPGMTGVELRKQIEEDKELREKSIPFVFFSTTVSPTMKREVYKMNVQGLFEKGDSFERIKRLLKLMYDYWQECRHPKN